MGRNMDEFTDNVKKRKWTELLISCNRSGQSKVEWCKEQGINIKTFYYWQHKLRTETMQLSEIHAIVPVNTAPCKEKSRDKIVIRANEISVELPADISQDVITHTIKALKC